MGKADYDIAVIGGGINGCGVARDAAGRGLSVFLCEKDDLASGTSSASTKLIHGGLRYLEYYEFRLVRESLKEREILLNCAPHIIWPLRFILPHHKGLRPGWLIRLGLFLYDHIGARKLLPGTSVINLRRDSAGKPLKGEYGPAFEYSDCWVMDSRLVVLNAMDARARGAEIRTRTQLLGATRKEGIWTLELLDKESGSSYTVAAKVLVNASGPWLDQLMSKISHTETSEHIRMVKGSHIIVDRLFTHSRAYIFQNSDGRIIFAIPYEDKFTLIGTTDVDYTGNPDEVDISEEETIYLCEAASEYFSRTIGVKDVVGSFSGIRPLFDDGKSEAKAATRDYVLKVDTGNNEAPLISIYGGKITTYRKLAESVMDRIAPFLPLQEKWTARADLPGGDFSPHSFEMEVDNLLLRCPVLDRELATRLFRHYGSRTHKMTAELRGSSDLGINFGHNLYSFEIDSLIQEEWARSAEDVLFRRTKLGLFLSPEQRERVEGYIAGQLDQPERSAEDPGEH